MKLYDLGATVLIVTLGVLAASWAAHNTVEGEYVWNKAKQKYERVVEFSDMYRDRDEPEWSKEAFSTDGE